MEIKSRGKFYTLMKNYGAIIISTFLIVAIAVTLLIVGLSPSSNEIMQEVLPPADENIDNVPVVNDTVISYGLPMENAMVIKDFSNLELQYNQTLNRWEAHLSVDLASENSSVMSIYDGKVTGVENDFLLGNVVTISHENGMVSVYASLDENLKVQVGDSVTKGQVIGSAGNSASSESADGVHLDFSMLLNGEEVDPNDYLSLQNK